MVHTPAANTRDGDAVQGPLPRATGVQKWVDNGAPCAPARPLPHPAYAASPPRRRCSEAFLCSAPGRRVSHPCCRMTHCWHRAARCDHCAQGMRALLHLLALAEERDKRAGTPSQRDLQRAPSYGRNFTKRKFLWSKQRIRIHVFGMNWADIHSQKGSHFRETEKRLVLESLAASGRIVVHPTPTLSYHARVNVSHMGIQGEWVQGISCSTWTPYAPHACIALALSNSAIPAGPKLCAFRARLANCADGSLRSANGRRPIFSRACWALPWRVLSLPFGCGEYGVRMGALPHMSR